MTLEIISLEKFVRKSQYEPDYTAEIKFDKTSITCEIYTNARLNYKNSKLIAHDYKFAKLNGNLYLRVESMGHFETVDNNKIEKELRKLIHGRI